jgi:RHH-type rel operon transcriptional repressor/antitoxin RelB
MTLSVRIPEELENRLTAVSKKAKITNSQLIREALITHLENLEDYYDAVAVLKRIKSGKEKTIPADEVFKKLGL